MTPLERIAAPGRRHSRGPDLPTPHDDHGSRSSSGLDPSAAEQAAELGLARVVLDWRRPDSHGFARFADAAIQALLSQHRPPMRSH